ncbi:hypothetical protein QYM36_012903 [Artemia franciscana]|uniref:Uncharacterized protein n=1 Tax=Artemia franciscana TaxID=6661 RepID=A0AA88HIK2_ARTSF|nr:hypothetical protein QYM36_012903 [Artemia franciscana]
MVSEVSEMDNLLPCPSFNWESASLQAWTKFEQHVNLIFSGLPIPKEFDDFFAGIGKLPEKVEIHVEKNAIPSINPVRRITFTLHERVKSELEPLEKLDIIERVVAPTKWVNSIMAVEKSDGSLRLCLDPRELNKSIQRPYYPMPTFEDIAAKIHGHNKFSKLDATSGY